MSDEELGSVSDEANIPDLADFAAQVLDEADWFDHHEAATFVITAVAPAIRQQAIRDVCEALREYARQCQQPSTHPTAQAAYLIERGFLPDTSPEEKW